MRKIAFIMMGILAVTLMACTSKNNNDQQNQNAMKKSNTLVAYFSASGVTKGVAEQLAQIAGADLMEITPEQPYTAADLDWHDSLSRSSVEMKDPASRPAIRPGAINPGDYEIIYVGFPIWWYTAPTIINTFIESCDLKGKTVIPFATSGGSTIDKACADLQASYPAVNWRPGRLLNNTPADSLKLWVEENKN
ncbi:MAG: flavodoxin [Muribaculaceae bacterium]|nr:flavodoxin [Muribaculaceae bacterium]